MSILFKYQLSISRTIIFENMLIVYFHEIKSFMHVRQKNYWKTLFTLINSFTSYLADVLRAKMYMRFCASDVHLILAVLVLYINSAYKVYSNYVYLYQLNANMFAIWRIHLNFVSEWLYLNRIIMTIQVVWNAKLFTEI